MPAYPPPNILVIGYGNTLRGDDGIGPELASLIEQQHLPGVFVVTVQQLIPELADPISAADAVVFLDAWTHPTGEVRLRPLDAETGIDLRPHFAQPAGLLWMAATAFGRCPAAWLLTAPGFEFGFRAGLSSRAQAASRAALDLFIGLWTQLWTQFAHIPTPLRRS